MVRIIVLLGMLALGFVIAKTLIKMFYDPGRCRKCGGKGYWQGTRPDEKERCGECFGTGRIPK
jgi:DnaJ-class molecular chaperone